MNRKKRMMLLLAGIMCVPIFNIHAETTNNNDVNDLVSLPVQILDFNADNLFFEYDMNSGLDFNNGGVLKDQIIDGKKQDIGYAPGLVVDDMLDENSNIIYKQESVERIAELVGKELLQRDYPNNSNYQKLKNKVLPPSSYVYNDVLNKNDNTYFYDTWQLDSSDSNIEKSDGKYYIPSSRVDVWEKNGEVYKCLNGSYTFSTDVQVADGYETCEFYTYFGSSDENNYNITVTISGNDIGTQSFKVNEVKGTEKINIPADKKFHVEIKATDPTQIGQARALCYKLYNSDGSSSGDNNLQNNAWKIDDSAVTQEGNVYYTGNNEETVYWKQDGDGVICSNGNAPLYRVFDVDGNCDLNFKYWASTKGVKVSVYNFENNAFIGSFTAKKEVDGWDEKSIAIPSGVSKVKICLEKEDDSGRIAALSITSEKYNLGDYETTVSRANQFNTLDDLLNYDDLTCMDYTYFMLTHLFKETSGLNINDDYYSYMVLQKNSDGSYTFDSNDSIVYDRKNKALYNYRENSSEQEGVYLNGFFPLEGKEDGLFSEKTTTHYQANNFERNYHFTLKSSGKFVYSEDQNQYFEFSGDDDVYVFINGHLAIDLGGAHLPAEARVDLNEHVEEFGLKDGEEYTFSFFYMERHTDASNLELNTNIQVYPEIQNPLQQRITFEFVDLDKEPTELYVQLYRTVNGVRNKYNVPIKFTCGSDGKWSSDELTILRKLEREGTEKYEIECISDLGNYRVQNVGEIVSVTDDANTIKEYKYILSDPNKDAPVIDGSITVILDEECQEKDYTYKLYNSNGEVIYEDNVTHQGQRVSQLAFGTYTIKVFDKDGNDITGKVTISKDDTITLTMSNSENIFVISYQDEGDAEKDPDNQDDPEKNPDNQDDPEKNPDNQDEPEKNPDNQDDPEKNPDNQDDPEKNPDNQDDPEKNPDNQDEPEKNPDNQDNPEDGKNSNEKDPNTDKNLNNRDTKIQVDNTNKNTKKSSNETVVKTGDDTNILVYVATALLAVAVLGIIFIARFKKKNR